MIWLERIFRRSNSPVNVVKGEENNPGSPKEKKSCNSPTNLHNTSGCQNQNITTGDNITTSSGNFSNNSFEKVDSSMKFEPVEFYPLLEKEKLHKDEILSRTSHPVSILRKPQVIKITSKNLVASPGNPNGQLLHSSNLVSSANNPSVSCHRNNQDESSSKSSISNNASNTTTNDKLSTSRVHQHDNPEPVIHQVLSPSISRKISHGSSSLSLDGELQQSFYFFQNSIGSGKYPLSLTTTSSSFRGCQICQSKNSNMDATSESINRLGGVRSTRIESSNKGIAVKNTGNNMNATVGDSPSLQCRHHRSFANICRNHRSSPIILPTLTSATTSSNASKVNRKNSNSRNVQILERRNDNSTQYDNIIKNTTVITAGSTQLNSSNGDQDKVKAALSSRIQKQKHEKYYEPNITSSSSNIKMETSEIPLRVPVATPTNFLPHHTSSDSQNDDGSLKDVLIGDVGSIADENIDDDPQSLASFSFNENHANSSFPNSFEDIVEDGFTKTAEDHPFIMQYFNENKNK